ncbi:MAG TPA: 2-oxo acid dehydrogenase subunit E2, partial [Clostridiales bacterium]|nr:2-oxo acid dehydrogenase subunit E2 [Clostridiales bacterium]
MATPVIMPRQGQSVESCIIGKWHKKPGDTVAVGDTLFTYETDKATFDETAVVSGTMLAVFFQEGDDVPCLLNVCVIGQPGEDISAFLPEGSTAEAALAVAAPVAAAPAATSAEAPAPATSAHATGSMPEAVSPRARSLAERSGADLRMATGSGPAGRVIERDVRQLIDHGILATPAVGSYDAGTVGTGLGGRVRIEDTLAKAAVIGEASGPVEIQLTRPVDAQDSWTEKHSTIRKVIARQMQQSLSTMAQLTHNASYDVTAIQQLRAQLKAAAEKGLAEKGYSLAGSIPTLGDIVLYAVSRVLLRHPACNAHYDDEKMTYFRHVNLGVAVDTPRGLMVPTLFAADTLSLSEISSQVKELAAECRKGTISPDKLKGGTFTVSNLGSFGIESFTPVINPPQTCILGVNTITT